MTELIRRDEAVAWGLRMHAYRGEEVVVLLGDGSRFRGYVAGVSATGAYAELDDGRWPEPVRVYVSQIVSVRRPHFHEEQLQPPDVDRYLAGRRRREALEPFPGQLSLAGEPPEVSRRSRKAVRRAVGMLLPPDQIEVLAALDRAAYRKSRVPAAAVAEEVGRSPQWVIRRLGRLAEMQLAAVSRDGRRYAWAPAKD